MCACVERACGSISARVCKFVSLCVDVDVCGISVCVGGVVCVCVMVGW